MDDRAQAALRVALNVTRVRTTRAEDYDRLVAENERLAATNWQLRRSVADYQHECARLNEEIADANREHHRLRNVMEDMEFEVEAWKNHCDHVKEGRQRVINAQKQKICVLKAKLKAKKR